MKDLKQRTRLLEDRINTILSETNLYIKNNNIDAESLTLGEIRIFADFLSSEYGDLITNSDIMLALTSIAFE